MLAWTVISHHQEESLKPQSCVCVVNIFGSINCFLLPLLAGLTHSALDKLILTNVGFRLTSVHCLVKPTEALVKENRSKWVFGSWKHVKRPASSGALSNKSLMLG